MGYGVSVTPPVERQYKFFFVDGLLGPVFRLVDTERFTVPVSAGLYLSGGLLFDLADIYAERTLPFFDCGPGFNITLEYRVNEKMYLYGRGQASITFNERNALIYISPSIGIGF
jgi:hypothetical protein